MTVQAFPREAFKALCVALLNVQPKYVTWAGEPDNSPLKPASNFLWASLLITTHNRTTVGWDVLRRTDNLDGTFTTLQTGRRQVVLSLKLETYDSPLTITADDVLEDLKSALWDPSSIDTLNGMGLSYETCGPVVPMPAYVNARAISTAVVDLVMAHSFQRTANYSAGTKNIGEVIGTGTVDGGVTLPYDVTGG